MPKLWFRSILGCGEPPAFCTRRDNKHAAYPNYDPAPWLWGSCSGGKHVPTTDLLLTTSTWFVSFPLAERPDVTSTTVYIYILWVNSVSHPGTHLNMLGYINDSCSILARIKMIKHHRISQTWKRNSSQQHATSQRSQNLSKQTWKTHGKTSQNTSSLHCVGGREEVESCRKKSWSGRPGSSCRCWSSRCIRFTNAGYSVRERKSSKASECMASSTKCSSKVFAWTKPQSINAFCIVSSACASNCWNNVNHSAFCSLFITSAFSKSAKAGQFAEKKWSTKLLHSEATNPITWSCLAMFQLIDLVGWEGDWCKGLQQA